MARVVTQTTVMCSCSDTPVTMSTVATIQGLHQYVSNVAL